MQSSCSSGYNSMLPTTESPSVFNTAATNSQQPPPKLQIVAGSANQAQMPISLSSQTLQHNASGSRVSSPLKRQNPAQIYGSPRVQLERQQRKRLLEQRQLLGCEMDYVNHGDAAGTSANGLLAAQTNEGVQSQWLTSQWMEDHYGGYGLKQFHFPHQRQHHQRPPSLNGSLVSGLSNLSNMSMMTTFSTLSVDTELSVQTNYDEVYGSQYMTSPLMPARENIDPNAMTYTSADLLQFVINENETSLRRLHAISLLQQRLKAGVDTYILNESFRLQVISTVILFPTQMINRYTRQQFVYAMEKCLSIVETLLVGGYQQIEYSLIHQLIRTRTAYDLVSFINECFNRELHSFGDAIKLLYTLFEHQLDGVAYRKLAARYIHVGRLMQLSGLSTKKSLLWNCIRAMLSVETVKEQFIQQCNGIVWCIQQLDHDPAEKNLVVAMSILNSISDNRPQVVQQILNLQGIQVISKFLTHGSPNLLYKVGKFLQQSGEFIQKLQFERHHIEEAIVKSLQLFGASDLKLVSFLSGFLCNFTFRPLVAHLVVQHNGIDVVFRLLKLLWHHQLPCADTITRKDINESIDNLLLILANLLSERCDKPLNWQCSFQLSQQPDSTKLLFEILEKTGIQLYGSRTILVINRLLQNMPNLIINLHTVYNLQEINFAPTIMKLYQDALQQMIVKGSESLSSKEAEQKQKTKMTLMSRLLDLLILMCKNENLKRNVGLLARLQHNRNFDFTQLMLHAAGWNREEIMIKTLDLIDTLADDFDTCKQWEDFGKLVLESTDMQKFQNHRAIQPKVDSIWRKIDFNRRECLNYEAGTELMMDFGSSSAW